MDADIVKEFSKLVWVWYPYMFSSTFLIKNPKQGHALKSQYKHLKFAWGIGKSIINNKYLS